MQRPKRESRKVTETVSDIIDVATKKELLEMVKTEEVEEVNDNTLKSLTLSIWDNANRIVLVNTMVQGVNASQLRHDTVSLGMLTMLHFYMGVGNWFSEIVQSGNDLDISAKFIMANQAFNPNNEDDLIQYYTVYGQHMYNKILENKLQLFINNCLVEMDKVLLRKVIDTEMEYQVAYKISVNKMIQLRKKLDKVIKFISSIKIF